jgi:hypothetical protein
MASQSKLRVNQGRHEGKMIQLTEAQQKEVSQEMVRNGCLVRFMTKGMSLNIVDGTTTPKGTNVMYQTIYCKFTKETARKIAKWLNVKAVFDQTK